MSFNLDVHGPRRSRDDEFWIAINAAVQMSPGPAGSGEVADLRGVFVSSIAHPTKLSEPPGGFPMPEPIHAHVPVTFAARVQLKRVKLYCTGLPGGPLVWQGADSEPVSALLRAEPAAWRSDSAEWGAIPCGLTDGTIRLEALRFIKGHGRTEPPWARLFPQVVASETTLLKQPELLAGGLAFEANVVFPWFEVAVKAPWLVTPVRPAREGVPGWRFTLDRSRLKPADRTRLQLAFQRLAEAMQPTTQAGDVPRARPHWVSLELLNGSDGLPDFYWEASGWSGGVDRVLEWRFCIGAGSIRLEIAGTGTPSRTLATAGATGVIKVRNEVLALEFSGSEEREEHFAGPRGDYRAARGENGWSETWGFSDVKTSFDAIEVAAWLRERQGVAVSSPLFQGDPAPLEGGFAFEAPPLWGFMPLEDGWAQIPFLNLSDEVYDAAGIRIDPSTGGHENALSSTVLYGNGPGDYRRNPMHSPHPWTIGLFGARAFWGSVTFDSRTLAQRGVELTLKEPAVLLNGFFQLAAAAPSARDALPDTPDWPVAWRTFSLRSAGPGAFAPTRPSPLLFALEKLVLSVSDADLESAEVGEVRFSLQDNEEVMSRLALKVPVPFRTIRPSVAEDARLRYLPLAPLLWRRHPTMPLVQSLPLTQTAQPPSYPNASRQLAPFSLPVGGDPAGASEPPRWIIPAALAWKFVVEGRALPRFADPIALPPAMEWAAWRTDLPLAWLSLPGLTSVPVKHALFAESEFLWSAYRHDLPVLDQLYALATTPHDADEGRRPALLPPPVEARAKEGPLLRADYGSRWTQLAEKAALAAADAVEAHGEADKHALRALIEPWTWSPVRAELTARWPGTIRFSDAVTDATIDLAAGVTPDTFTALRGLQGRFSREAGARLQLRSDETEGCFRLTAGAMHAWLENGAVRDQRGLWRGASRIVAHFVVLPIVFNGSADEPFVEAEMWTALQAVRLDTVGRPWLFWFRELLTERQGEASVFRRLVPAADMDVNDTDGGGRERAWRTGHEWRVGVEQPQVGARDAAVGEPPGAPHLELFGLHVFPLRLERVEIAGGAIRCVEMVVRLQLPITATYAGQNTTAFEQTTLRNSVRLRFAGAGLALQSVAIEPGPGGDKDTELSWPLRLGTRTGGAEVAANASLRLSRLSLQSPQTGGVPGALVGDGRVEFDFLGALCSLPLNTRLRIDPAGVATPIDFDSFASGSPAALVGAQMMLDLKTGHHRLDLRLRFEWGGARQLRVRADVWWPIVGTSERRIDAVLVHGSSPASERIVGLNSRIDASAYGLTERSVRIAWEGVREGGTRPCIFPGMELSGSKGTAVGCAVLWFDITKVEAGGSLLPVLTVRGAFVEALFVCHWGTSIHDPASGARVEAAFGSSSGHLHLDYLLQARIQNEALVWVPNYLLNGHLEVKNLVSWPSGMALHTERAELKGYGAGQYTLLEENKDKLRALAGWLMQPQNKDVTVEIFAQGDGGGSEGNRRLAVRRAQVAGAFLVAKGVAKPRIGIVRVPRGAPASAEVIARPTTNLPFTKGAEDFSLVRHALRVPFVQHEIPADLPVSAEASFLDFGTSGWQFLAATEHVLAEVPARRGFDGTLSIPNPISVRAGWGCVQEVRLCSRKMLLDLFSRLASTNTVDPQAYTGIAPTTASGFGPHYAGGNPSVVDLLRSEVGFGDVSLDDSLLVEASAALWLSPGEEEIRTENLVTLAFLPDSTLQAEPLVPADFYSGTQTRPWGFASMPFLGRLQPASRDELRAASSTPVGALRIDPVLWLARRSMETTPGRADLLALHLACRGWEIESTVVLGAFELRTSSGLDPASAGRAFEVLANPVRDDAMSTGGIRPVMSSQSDSSAALSAAPATLAVAYEPWRHPGDGRPVLPRPPNAGTLVWRPDSLLLFQGIGTSSTETFSFAISALQVAAALPVTNGSRAMAATVLPGAESEASLSPGSFALSPFRRVVSTPVDDTDSSLISTIASYAELLVPPSPDGPLWPDGPVRRLAARGWQLSESAPAAPDWSAWARDLCAATAPFVPFAVVRVREIVGSRILAIQGHTESAVLVRYGFLIVDTSGIGPAATVLPRPLRSPPAKLCFREGQFGGFQALVRGPDAGLQPFEGAAPLVDGVQPVWTVNLPSDQSPDAGIPQLSATRFSVKYYEAGTDGLSGTVGDADLESDRTRRVWWCSASHQVQWRPAGQDRLPPLFRARSIGGFLTAPPGLPLPVPDWTPEDLDEAKVTAWQPILPHAMCLISSGHRPGVPILHRHSVTTQTVGKTKEDSRHTVESSAAPIQHRSPRPVPLPQNSGRTDRDMQPAAAYYLPTINCLHDDCPGDNLVRVPSDPSVDAPQALAFRVSPASVVNTSKDAAFRWGMLPAEGNGTIWLEIEFWRFATGDGWKPQASESGDADWRFEGTGGAPALWLSDGTRILTMRRVGTPDILQPGPQLLEPDFPMGEADNLWKEWAAILPHGAALTLGMGVGATPAAADKQVSHRELRVKLHLVREGFELPALRPRFVQFEDPAYNRRLASAPLQVRGSIVFTGVAPSIRVTLASDRQEYDPSGETILALRAEEPGTVGETALKFKRIDREGMESELPASLVLRIGVPLRVTLAAWRLEPGDVLRILLWDAVNNAPAGLDLSFPIVARPVLPVPEAAFGLLRMDPAATADVTVGVACARFAWSPAPARIDLLDPSDLFLNEVRRRAIFQWTDFGVFRANADWRVQKINPSGSTHIPSFER